jgi:dihydroorotate dehydrogenase electron transfer subunit
MEAPVMRSALVASRVEENRRTVTLVMEAEMDAAPGQFAMVWVPGLDEKPFSIAGARPLTLTVARVGPVSEAIHALAPGDRLWFRGPFGRGFPLEGRAPLLAGGGYGAAPLWFLAKTLLDAGSRPPVVALGAKTAEDLLFAERFRALGAAVHLATEDGSAGSRGLVTDEAARLLAGGGIDHLFACGPEGMLEALAGLACSARITADLSHEAYMRCGVGLCGACEHGARLVCLDGPVFRVPS